MIDRKLICLCDNQFKITSFIAVQKNAGYRTNDTLELTTTQGGGQVS